MVPRTPLSQGVRPRPATGPTRPRAGGPRASVLGVQIKPLAILTRETADFVQPVGPAGDFVAGNKFHGALDVVGPTGCRADDFQAQPRHRFHLEIEMGGPLINPRA